MASDLETALIKCMNYSGREMVRRPEWGDVNFDHISADLDRFFSTCSELTESPFKDLPPTRSRRASTELGRVLTALEKIDRFGEPYDGETPYETRNRIVHDAKFNIDEFLGWIGPWITRLNEKRPDAQVGDAFSSREEFDAFLNAKRKEIDVLSNEFRKFLGKFGASNFAKSFDEEAVRQVDAAQKWLIATVATFVITLCSGIAALYWNVGSEQTTVQTVIQLVKTLAIMGMLLTSALWCGKIYRALRHQSAVNRHRYLSLQTFEAFISAATDPSIKDAVLMEATKTIFTHVQTGYLEAGRDGSGQDSKTIEILRSSGSGRKPDDA